MKEGPGGEAGAFKEETSQSRDQGALDAPILFQGTNQARRGSRGGPSRKTSYRLDSHCDGTAKNGDEKQVTVGECKATTEAREQGKSDQLS